jgi:hypothetical protein
VADVDRTLAYVPKDLAVRQTDSVE